MAIYKIDRRQSLRDACIQVYGTLQLLFQFAKDNNLQIDSDVSINDELFYDPSIASNLIVNAISRRQTRILNFVPPKEIIWQYISKTPSLFVPNDKSTFPELTAIASGSGETFWQWIINGVLNFTDTFNSIVGVDETRSVEVDTSALSVGVDSLLTVSANGFSQGILIRTYKRIVFFYQVNLSPSIAEINLEFSGNFKVKFDENIEDLTSGVDASNQYDNTGLKEIEVLSDDTDFENVSSINLKGKKEYKRIDFINQPIGSLSDPCMLHFDESGLLDVSLPENSVVSDTDCTDCQDMQFFDWNDAILETMPAEGFISFLNCINLNTVRNWGENGKCLGLDTSFANFDIGDLNNIEIKGSFSFGDMPELRSISGIASTSEIATCIGLRCPNLKSFDAGNAKYTDQITIILCPSFTTFENVGSTTLIGQLRLYDNNLLGDTPSGGTLNLNNLLLQGRLEVQNQSAKKLLGLVGLNNSNRYDVFNFQSSGFSGIQNLNGSRFNGSINGTGNSSFRGFQNFSTASTITGNIQLSLCGIDIIMPFSTINAINTVSITLSDNGMSQSVVDGYYNEFVGNGGINCALNIGGSTNPNAAPSAAGVSDRTILLSRGWTITDATGTYP